MNKLVSVIDLFREKLNIFLLLNNLSNLAMLTQTFHLCYKQVFIFAPNMSAVMLIFKI